MSKINPVLSRTRHDNADSKSLSWLGLKLLLKITKSTECSLILDSNSSSFPVPIKYFGCGVDRFPTKSSLAKTPAALASSMNSSLLALIMPEDKFMLTRIA